MSYETSPILNRIKIRKGWKNSHFPLKTLNYSHEIILWFKLYLLLKNYLFLQKIMVLACEIRSSENHKKILYLSITKQFQKKKLPKSKWKSKSLLRESQSLITKIYNKKARFLLYQDLKTLKKNSSLFLNQAQKKILSKAWIAKPRFSSWINLTKSTFRLRKKTKSDFNLTWTKKKKLLFPKNTDLVLKICLKKNLEKKFFSKQIFWQRKQKKILSLICKTQKELMFIKKNLFLISRWHISCKEEPFSRSSLQKILLKNLLTTLTLKYTNQKILLVKIQNLYRHVVKTYFFFLKGKEKILKKNLEPTAWKSFQTRKIHEKRKNIRLKIFWHAFKKQMWVDNNNNFSFLNKEKKLFLFRSNFFKKTQKYRLLNTTNFGIFSSWINQYLSKIQPILAANFFRNQKIRFKSIYKIFFKHILKQHFQLLSTLAKTKFLQQRTKILPWQLMQLIRFKQQDKLSFLTKKKTKKSQKVRFKLLSKKKKDNSYTSYQYRLPSTLLYKDYLTLLTGFRLTYLLQNLIQEYFGLFFTIKISWPLIQFKNLKFYRLLFPNYKPLSFEENSQEKLNFIKLNERKNVKRNRYLYVGRRIKHLKLQKPLAQIYNHLRTLKKKFRQKTLYSFDSNKSRKNNLTAITNLRHLRNQKKKKHVFLTKLQKKPLKKNSYLILKAKSLQKKSQKRLFWASKTPDIGNFLTTLTIFSKYLDPQPLADHLAKLISESKNHASLIKFMEKILHVVQMKRGVGYRIALMGRIDGANKSRTLYLKKLNRNRARQNFSKNVNFAMSQARATIGVFSIKIWIYF